MPVIPSARLPFIASRNLFRVSNQQRFQRLQQRSTFFFPEKVDKNEVLSYK